MDIAYILKEKPDNYDELRYSLRSLKNIQHDKLFICGYLPKFINNRKVTYIPTLQTLSKYENARNNKIELCKCSLLSDDFILFNDDFYMLEKINDPLEELNLCFNTIDYVYYRFSKIFGRESAIMLEDVKQLSYNNYKDFKCKKFLSSGDNTFCVIKDYLQKLFPEKSEYEI